MIRVNHYRRYRDCDLLYTRQRALDNDITWAPEPKGGVTLAVIEVGGRRFTGESRCSNLDNFCRAKGRTIAVGRAFKMARTG